MRICAAPWRVSSKKIALEPDGGLGDHVAGAGDVAGFELVYAGQVLARARQ